MIDLEFLERLIRTLDESGIDHVEIERGGTRIRVSKSPSAGAASGAAAPAASTNAASPPTSAPTAAGNPTAPTAAAGSPPEAQPMASNLAEITSPMVGTFYRAAAPDLPPFTDIGKRISKGDPLCIIEAMKLMNELEAEIQGVVREVCVSNGEPVEYGQVLFRVEPT
jgi:acetyl-CoA carboxylase biotin carboxyl carrier protein